MASRADNELLHSSMEGISEGRAVDSCFCCALLYPELDACPHCGKRLRYEPASMMSAEQLQERCETLVKQFQAQPNRGNAEALLRLLHRYGDEVHITLGAQGTPSIDSLRRAYEQERSS